MPLGDAGFAIGIIVAVSGRGDFFAGLDIREVFATLSTDHDLLAVVDALLLWPRCMLHCLLTSQPAYLDSRHVRVSCSHHS
jgi:hypothetical protein